MRWLWFDKGFNFLPEVFVLVFSKFLNITYRLNHVHWIEDEILGLGVVSTYFSEKFCLTTLFKIQKVLFLFLDDFFKNLNTT